MNLWETCLKSPCSYLCWVFFSLLTVLSYVSCDGWEGDEEKGVEDEAKSMALESLKTWRKNVVFCRFRTNMCLLKNVTLQFHVVTWNLRIDKLQLVMNFKQKGVQTCTCKHTCKLV